MKHPALVRVFSVVLAVMCLIMLLSGGFGLRDTESEYQEAQAYALRLADRIATYRELDGKLADNESYEQAQEKLEKKQKEHDKKAAQHRTDMAEYTAKKGGYTMGENMAIMGREQLAEAKGQLQSVKNLQAQLGNEIASLNNAAAGCAAVLVSNPVAPCMAALSAAMQTNPPGAPPTLADPPAEPVNALDENDPASVAEWEQYNAALDTYNTVTVPQHEQDMATYLGQVEAYNNACASSIDAGSVSAWMAAYNAGAAARDSLVGTLGSLSAAASALGSSGVGGMPDPSSIPSVPEPTDPTSLADPQQMMMALGAIEPTLQGQAYMLSSLAGGLQGAPALMDGMIKAGEDAIKKGEHELQAALENIWYNMGELEKEAVELNKEKERLAQEAESLDKLILSTDEKRELENKHSSARALLKNIDEIAALVDTGGEIAESAESYLAQYKQDAQRIYDGRRLICAFALLAGASGFVGIPAAFEKTKKRFWLIAPVLLCLLCSCACDGINMHLGLGQMYAALFTAIFALLQLLIVIPRNKPVKTE